VPASAAEAASKHRLRPSSLRLRPARTLLLRETLSERAGSAAPERRGDRFD